MKIYSARQAAAELGCHLNTVKAHAAALRLGKLNSHWLITEGDLGRIRQAMAAAQERILAGKKLAKKSK
jgi:hypothetical protein